MKHENDSTEDRWYKNLMFLTILVMLIALDTLIKMVASIAKFFRNPIAWWREAYQHRANAPWGGDRPSQLGIQCEELRTPTRKLRFGHSPEWQTRSHQTAKP